MFRFLLLLLPLAFFTPLANAVGSDLIGDASVITMPFSEIVDNRNFTEVDADDYCDENPAGDFFYKYTPADNETINIKAVSRDTEIYVFDLAAATGLPVPAGNDLRCFFLQDDDNIDIPNWYTQTYPGDLYPTDENNGCLGCSENANVDLVAGTEYVIVIASNEDEAKAPIFVSMAVGADAAVVPAGTPASTTAVPVMPLWLLGFMGGMLSLLGVRNLSKA